MNINLFLQTAPQPSPKPPRRWVITFVVVVVVVVIFIITITITIIIIKIDRLQVRRCPMHTLPFVSINWSVTSDHFYIFRSGRMSFRLHRPYVVLKSYSILQTTSCSTVPRLRKSNCSRVPKKKIFFYLIDFCFDYRWWFDIRVDVPLLR